MRARLLNIAMGLVGVWATMALAGCGGGDGSSDGNAGVGKVVNGAPIFRRVCAACHGPAGEGMPGLGKDMTHSTFIAESSDEALLEFVKVGRLPSDPLSAGMAPMPPKGGDPTLTDQQLRDVIAFVRRLQQ